MASTHPDSYARWNASEYVYSLKYSSFDVLEKVDQDLKYGLDIYAS